MSVTAVRAMLAPDSEPMDVVNVVANSSDRRSSCCCEVSLEDTLAPIAQLAQFASMHQSSEYHRLKFGPKGVSALHFNYYGPAVWANIPRHKSRVMLGHLTSAMVCPGRPRFRSPTIVAPYRGVHILLVKLTFAYAEGSPMTYVPMSLQVPDRVKQLQEYQARCTEQKAWWLSEKKAATQNTSIDLTEVISELSHLRLDRPSSSMDLQQELSAAMSAPLVHPQLASTQSTRSEPPLKTSETHPILVSPMIPFELLRIISSHLVQTNKQSPVMFDLSPTYFLDRVTSCLPNLPPDMSSGAHVHPTPSPSLLGLRSIKPPYAPVINATGPAKRGQILWAAPVLRRALCWTPSTDLIHPRQTHVNVSHDSLTSLEHTTQSLNEPVKQTHLMDMPLSEDTDNEKSTDSGLQRSHLAPSVVRDPGRTPNPHTDIPVPPVPPQFAVPTSFTLGNLFLSSCPGKKVRLNGPVKGRAAICRDLRVDLQRIKELGVACVVCCLDDVELELLGVSWSEYASLANELELDILRIPVPEGLAPASVHDLDAEMATLINAYTLRGSAVLVHCRGGLGRAGVIACCWILKLGLCGWIETAPTFAFTAPDTTSSAPGPPLLDNTAVRRDTMQLVERVIAVVRRRRSPKAVETYEQVRFLVDYVELLRAKTAPEVGGTDSVLHWDVRDD